MPCVTAINIFQRVRARARDRHAVARGRALPARRLAAAGSVDIALQIRDLQMVVLRRISGIGNTGKQFARRAAVAVRHRVRIFGSVVHGVRIVLEAVVVEDD